MSQTIATTTGMLATTVRSTPQGFVWRHDLGADASIPFARIPLEVSASLGKAQNLVVSNAPTETSREYLSQAGSPFLELLTSADTQTLKTNGAHWAEALNSIHRTPVTQSVRELGLPRTLVRAQAWLHGDWLLVAERVGKSLQLVRQWTESLQNPTSNRLTHGHPGMAHWVTIPSAGTGTLLSGEDIGFIDPRYDATWVLGEIAELKGFYPMLARQLEAVESGFLAELDATLHPIDLSAGIAFRLLQHAFDWRHYAGATDADALLLIDLAIQHLKK